MSTQRDYKFYHALAIAILVYHHKYERPQRAGNSVPEEKCKQSWDAIVEMAAAITGKRVRTGQ
jgi:hypothetical protein